MKENEIVSTKVVIFGDQKSGKTKFLESWTDSPYNEDYEPTIGIDCKVKRLNESTKLFVWDCSGNERFKRITVAYYKDAVCGLYCVDLTKEINREKIKSDIDRFKQFSPNSRVILVGTKKDAAPTDNIAAFTSFAKDQNLYCIAVSAKEKTDLTELQEHLIAALPALNYLKVVRQSALKLPLEKMYEILKKLDELESRLRSQQDPVDLSKYLDDFSSDCKQILKKEHPTLIKQIGKLVAVIAIGCVTALLGFGIGFGVGFVCASGLGPGAFIAAFVGGVLGSGVSAYSFFKQSKADKENEHFLTKLNAMNQAI